MPYLNRAVRAVIVGLVAGLITLILLLVVEAIAPRVTVDAQSWAFIVGVLAALYSFVSGQEQL